MSFVKKTLKKVWGFVKKYWKEIAMVAAIAFTAGVATIGFAAFSGVSGIGGFMGAVGQTMWAGVAATAGSMGIGGGATVPTTAATMASGMAGTQVGLGAAWGAGGGYGLGVAGNTAQAAAAEAAATQPTTMIGFLEKGAAETSLKKAGIEVAKIGTEELVKETAKTGLSDAAWKAMGVAAPIAGAALAAAGEPSEFKNVDYFGTTKDGPIGPGVNALADPTGGQADGTFDPGGTAMASQGAPGGEADALFKDQMYRSSESIARPLMGQGGTGRNPDGSMIRPEDEQGLMSMQGRYGYG